jgi:hypothetical protein
MWLRSRTDPTMIVGPAGTTTRPPPEAAQASMARCVASVSRRTSVPVTPNRRRSKEEVFASAQGEGCAFIGKT